MVNYNLKIKFWEIISSYWEIGLEDEVSDFIYDIIEQHDKFGGGAYKFS
jgi:hypothetical protein